MTTGRRAIASGALIAGLLMLTAGPVAARGTTTLQVTDQGGCVFEVDYTWAGFGGAGTPAYGGAAMYVREPGQTDVLMDFSGQVYPADQTLKSGEFIRQFDEHQWLQGYHVSADAQLVFDAALVAAPGHRRGEYGVAGSELVALLAIPAGCAVIVS